MGTVVESGLVGYRSKEAGNGRGSEKSKRSKITQKGTAGSAYVESSRKMEDGNAASKKSNEAAKRAAAEGKQS